MLCKKMCFFVLLLAVVLVPALSFAEIENTFHGQFRINSYFQDQSKEDTFGKDIAASRLRFRPTWDVNIDKTIKLHMQLNIGHINSNTANARYNQSGDPAVGLRHGYIETPIVEKVSLVAGLVPLSDKFGDILFSGDWDFNPLAYTFLINQGGVDIRIAGGKLIEGMETNNQGSSSNNADDLTAYLADADFGKFGASYYLFSGNDAYTDGGIRQHYYGVRYKDEFGNINFNAFLLGNNGKFKEDGTFNPNPNKDFTNAGFAGKIELKMPVGAAKVGFMGIYALGDKDFKDNTKDSSSSFITPMSLIGHHGYWGYTGKLNIQGPTDTGIDDPIRVDGGSYANQTLGLGLTTIQANVDVPIIPEKFSAYGAIGTYFLNSKASGKNKNVGTDIYLQGKYMLGKNLGLEFGGDIAFLGKGHFDSYALADGKSRVVTLLFTRLQLEY